MKKPRKNFVFAGLKSVGGERGIRTPGPVTVNSFQDYRDRPLCQLSAAKVIKSLKMKRKIFKANIFFTCLNIRDVRIIH